MVNEARRAELEGLSGNPLYFEALCQGAGLDTSLSKEELIDRLLESEGQVPSEPAESTEPTEPTEPAEPSEPEPTE